MSGALVALLARSAAAAAQSHAIVDSLVSRALVVNPQLRVAEAQASAARVRIGRAGAWADPMLMAGIQNLPLSRQRASGPATNSGPEPMTMRMVGVSQTIPYPGKTSLQTAIARADADVADARLESVRREIRREIHRVYYDVVAARMQRGLIERQQQVARSILPATEARYVSGTSIQADVLKARTEAALLVEERNEAIQLERAALAQLNAMLDQPSNTFVAGDSLPADAIALDDGVPSLDSLEALALQTNPRLRERRSVLAVRAKQAALADRSALPDFDLGLQYGQRDQLPDMITVTVSVPVPVYRGRKQRTEGRAAQFDHDAAAAELRKEENAVRSEIAVAYAALERSRANLKLLDGAILPQTRATFTSASGTYQTGRGELLGVLDTMRALFGAETMYVRALAEYAKARAELEALVDRRVSS